MLHNVALTCLFIMGVHTSTYEIGKNATARNSTLAAKRAMSVFSVVKFPNSACSSSTSGRNGTCYTSSECTAYRLKKKYWSLKLILNISSGTASGNCASSFGVCCIFEKTCDGGSISQNLTYFTSTARALGSACRLTICKVRIQKFLLTYFFCF